MPIRLRIGLALGVLAFCTLLAAGLGVWSLGRSQRAYTRTLEQDLPSVTALLEVDRALLTARLAHAGAAPDSEALAELVAEVDQHWREFLSCVAAGAEPPSPIQADFERSWAVWRQSAGGAAGLGAAAFDSLRALVVTLIAERSVLVSLHVAEQDRVQRADARRLIWLASGAGLLAAALALWLCSALAAPLRRAAAALEAMSRGDLSTRLDAKGRDEIGSLARSSERLVQRLEQLGAVAVQIADGDLSAEFVPASPADRLGQAIARMLARLQAVAESTDRIARGDLSRPLEPQSERDRVGQAHARMHAALTRLASSAESIAQGDLNIPVHADSSQDRLGTAFIGMVLSLREMAAAAKKISLGNLKVKLAPRGERDQLGQAFGRMTQTLGRMAEAAERLGKGDLEVEIAPASNQDRLGEAFQQMVRSMRAMAEAADRIAGGDLAVAVPLRSPQDRLGAAFQRMVASLERTAQAAEGIAQGDLSIAVEPHSDADRLGRAFQRMQATLLEVERSADRIARGDLEGEVRVQGQGDRLGRALEEMHRSLRAMAQAAEGIADGDLEVELEPHGPEDRLGHAFVRMATSLRGLALVAARITAGELDLQFEPRSERDRLGRAVVAMLAALREQARLAQRLAAGDLTAQARPRGPEDQLGQAFARMVENLRRLVAQIDGSAQGVAQVTQALSQGNRQLEGRTQEQSRTLESAQLAIEAAVARAQESVERCRNAGDLVLECRTVAERGKQMLAAWRSALSEIADTSQEIQDSVRAINSHASQTHLLALNARIEAARAGEHGRGFGVVASEVGNLASDSGQVARGITELAQTSSRRIHEGGEQLEATHRTFEAIASSVDQVAALVIHISESVDAQACEVRSLAERLAELDRFNQENLALSVRTAQDSRGLDGSVQELGRALAHFRRSA
jgi:methyl-accepting chemotaxis protein